METIANRSCSPNETFVDNTPSICSELNLRTEDLNVEELLGKPVYRRLYNIVVHDTNKNQYGFRKNLIKQLYFMLKITPMMKAELQDNYLDQLEKWYNLNDHKKTEIQSAGMKGKMQQFNLSPDQKPVRKSSRPQSGACWSKNISPFLRPYTAKRPMTGQKQQSQSRPESGTFNRSRFSANKDSIANQSTKLGSCQQLTVKECALSIQEQLQISKEFLNNNRTIHPESEPIYQQLFKIIKQVCTGQALKHEYIKADSQSQIQFKKDKQEFFAKQGSASSNTMHKIKSRQGIQGSNSIHSLQQKSSGKIIDLDDEDYLNDDDNDFQIKQVADEDGQGQGDESMEQKYRKVKMESHHSNAMNVGIGANNDDDIYQQQQQQQQEQEHQQDDNFKATNKVPNNGKQQHNLQQQLTATSHYPNSNDKKVFTQDREFSNYVFKKSIKGYLFARQQEKDDQFMLKKANNKYSHLTNNKFVNYSKDDNQIVRSYVNYTRAKSAMKSQLSRKSETKRLLSAARSRSRGASKVLSVSGGNGVGTQQVSEQRTMFGQISMNNVKPMHVSKQRPLTAMVRPSSASKKSQILVNPPSSSTKVFDFSSIPSLSKNSSKQNLQGYGTHYNQRQQLDRIYTEPMKTFKKFNKTINASEIQAETKNALTRYDNFLTQERINPIADIHVERHNQQALQEIQKIKQKVGSLGKKGISVECLMKALYIDGYKGFNSHTTINSKFASAAEDTSLLLNGKQCKSQMDISPQWKGMNPYFNMLSNGSKKKMKKKKHRKLNKKQLIR